MNAYRGLLILITLITFSKKTSAQQCPLVAAVVSCQVGSPPVQSTAIRLKWIASTFPGCTPANMIPDKVEIRYTTQSPGGPLTTHIDTINKIPGSCAEAPLYAVNYHAPQLDGCTCNLYYGQVVISGNACTYIDGFLPVELGDFKGNINKNAVQLQWTTLSENKSAFFTVERSFDGKEFKAIGNKQAAGVSSTTKNYSFDDNIDLKSIGSSLSVYYRLLMLDVDGNFAYSPIISMEIDRSGSGLAFINSPDFSLPNPTLYYYSDYEDNVTCRIVDMNGKVFFSQSYPSIIGNNEISLGEKVEHLASGIYVLSLEHKSGLVSRKIFKAGE